MPHNSLSVPKPRKNTSPPLSPHAIDTTASPPMLAYIWKRVITTNPVRRQPQPTFFKFKQGLDEPLCTGILPDKLTLDKPDYQA
jgi:hypothetical protein